MATRIEQINERRARRQAKASSPLPASVPPSVPDTPSDQTVSPAYGPVSAQVPTPSQVAGSQVDNAPAQITYANSGIAPTMTSNRSYRQGALQDMSEEQFRQAQPGMNASDKEYWSEQARLNPLNTYANLQNYFASEETPQEKQKRERREHLGQVFSNLGNLIGNAAQLYYTAQGAEPADLNRAALMENERMRRIKEKRDALKAKQDALLAEAKGNDIRNAYNIRLAREKAAADAEDKAKEREQEWRKFALELEADARRDKDKNAREDKELAEKIRHNRAMEAAAGDGGNGKMKVLDSGIGWDSYVYTRNTKLSANETIQFVKRYLKSDELDQFKTGDRLTGKEETDWDAAAAYILQSGRVPADELAARGFIRSGKAGERPLNDWGYDPGGFYGKTYTGIWSLSGNGNSNSSTSGGWSLNN